MDTEHPAGLGAPTASDWARFFRVTRRSGTRTEVADVSTVDREEVLAIATFCTSAHRATALITTVDLRFA